VDDYHKRYPSTQKANLRLVGTDLNYPCSIGYLHRSRAATHVAGLVPAVLATVLLLLSGGEIVREGHYLSGFGIGFLGILYFITALYLGVATNRRGPAAAGLFGFVASVAIYLMSFLSSAPLFPLSR
jgi:hypothetical protein